MLSSKVGQIRLVLGRCIELWMQPLPRLPNVSHNAVPHCIRRPAYGSSGPFAPGDFLSAHPDRLGDNVAIRPDVRFSVSAARNHRSARRRHACTCQVGPQGYVRFVCAVRAMGMVLAEPTHPNPSSPGPAPYPPLSPATAGCVGRFARFPIVPIPPFPLRPSGPSDRRAAFRFVVSSMRPSNPSDNHPIVPISLAIAYR